MYTPASVDAVIDDKLFIGNLSAATSLNSQRELGITHILSVCPDLPAPKSDPKHLCIPVEDTEYDDLLIHLPKACQFIQHALDAGGRVLVHCVMGISRSATVATAFLMESRHLSPLKALSVVKQRRAQIHPNYGFLKQLNVFEASGYQPCSTNGAYISWKRRQEQDVTNFLNAVHDTIAIIPNQLYLSSEFPDDPMKAKSLLLDLRMTHVLSISPSEISPSIVPAAIKHHRMNVPQRRQDDLLLSLPETCRLISEAVDNGGQVLVHCDEEWKAAVVVCAYAMRSQQISPSQATVLLESALPLFNRTRNFSKHLELFHTCGYNPTADHPVVKGSLGTNGQANAKQASDGQAEAAAAATAAINAVASQYLGKKYDVAAFNETMANIQSSRDGIATLG